MVYSKVKAELVTQWICIRVSQAVSYENQQHSTVKWEVCKYADVDPAIIRPGVPDCGVTNATCRAKLFMKA